MDLNNHLLEININTVTFIQRIYKLYIHPHYYYFNFFFENVQVYTIPIHILLEILNYILYEDKQGW